jgi:hypothetical protein
MDNIDQELQQAAAGFMRTYAYLIQYEVDFRKAQSSELGLIPTDDGHSPITYERFAKFIATFAKLNDEEVRPRYHYGEMRLTRLNWFARILLRRLTYHHIHAQWNEYLGRFLAPFLTVFLVFSTLLTAMQVELAVQSAPQDSGLWNIFSQASRWFSVVTIFLVIVISVFFIFLVLFMLIHDQLFAQRVLYRKRDVQKRLETNIKSGVV